MCRHYYTFTKAFIGSSASLYNFELFYVIHVFYVYEQFQATSKQGVYVSGERRRMSLFICKATTTTTTTVARMSALENYYYHINDRVD